MTSRRKPVPHQDIVRITRQMLASKPEVLVIAIATKAKCSVRSVVSAIEQEGYEFNLNVAVGLGSGFCKLPMEQWSVESLRGAE